MGVFGLQTFGGAAPGFKPRTSCLRVRSVTITLQGPPPLIVRTQHNICKVEKCKLCTVYGERKDGSQIARPEKEIGKWFLKIHSVDRQRILEDVSIIVSSSFLFPSRSSSRWAARPSRSCSATSCTRSSPCSCTPPPASPCSWPGRGTW